MITLNETQENFYNIKHNGMIISLNRKQILQLYKLFSESDIMLNFKQFKSLVSTSLLITFYGEDDTLCYYLENRADILWYKIVYNYGLKKILEFNDLSSFIEFMSKVKYIFLRMRLNPG